MASIAPPPSNGGTGGYEYKFVTTPPDWLICTICQYPSREPYLSNCCGNTFCKSCLEGVKKATTVTKACPICRNEKFVTVDNKQADRVIRGHHVFCTNKEKGCAWKGELNDIVYHLENNKGCQFEEVTCPNGCGRQVQRPSLAGHVENECAHRKICCQYCGIKEDHQFIANGHMEQCPKLPIPCPNKCKVDVVTRDSIDKHRKICPLEIIHCEYGCKERMVRMDQNKHDKEKMEEHLSFNKRELDDIKKVLAELVSDLQKKIAEIETAAQKRITELASKLEDKTKEIEQVRFELIRHNQLNCEAIQLSSSDRLVPVIVKIPTKRHGTRLHSDPFYTHDKGYKMCLGIHLGANNLGIWIKIMKGPNDGSLTWPLKGQCEVKLLNQIKNSDHYSQHGKYTENGHMRITEAERNHIDMWYNHRFISIADLTKHSSACQYLKDDTIFIQVDYKLGK